MKHYLRKSTLLSAGAVAVSALGLWAASEHVERPSVPDGASFMSAPAKLPTLDEDEIVFHGSVEQSERSDWPGQGTTGQRYGVYSFTLNSLPKPEGPIQDNRSSGGGFWVDGHYYCIQIGNKSLSGRTNVYAVYDTETWKRTNTQAFSTSDSNPSLTDCTAMAYDYITGKAYAAGVYIGNDNVRQLRELNMETGEMTNVGDLNGLDTSFSGMAFDSEGVLWATAKSSYRNQLILYKVDKTTGQILAKIPTDLNQKSNTAALCFDHRNNKLYYTSRMVRYFAEIVGGPETSEDYWSAVYEIDRATGKTTMVQDFPEWEIFGSLYIEDSHPQAPEGVKNLQFKYKSGSLTEGNVTCTLPTQRYNRQALSGNLKVEVYVDGILVETKTGLKPGAAFTGENMILSRDAHKIKVYAYNDNDNKSVPRYVNVYGGNDRPAVVKNLQAQYSDHKDAITLTWEAPTTGHNGGNLDGAEITYKVVRRPDWVTVAEGLKECTFTDTPDRQQELTQYEVYAVSTGGESDAVRTTPALVGQPAKLPYLETFDSYTASYRYTVIKNEDLAREDGNYWMYSPDYQDYIYFLSYGLYGYGVKTDGFIVTPSIEFKEGYAYRVEWNSTVGEKYYKDLTNNLDLLVGEFPTKESCNRVIYHNRYLMCEDDEQQWSAIFVAQKGDRHVAFHNYSDTALVRTTLDNIRITEYGAAGIPQAPEVLGFEKDEETVTLNVQLPTLNVVNEPVEQITEVRLYTSDRKRLLAAQKVEAGATTVKITDKNPTFGYNNYAIVAINKYGTGMEAYYKVNMLPDVPKSVVNLKLATSNDGNDVNLAWSYPSDMLGVEGNKLTTDELEYDIYIIDGYEQTLIATVPGKETSYTIGDIMSRYPSERQTYITFGVTARTRGGSANAVSGKVLCGRAYEIPMHENFAQMITPWNGDGCVWAYFDGGKQSQWDPMCTATEGNLLSFIPNSSTGLGVYISPRLNMTALLNPKFSFKVWQDPSSKLDGAFIQVGVLVEKDGAEQEIEYISPRYTVKSETAGWVSHEVDLSDYAKYPRVSIVFRAQGSRGGNIHIDSFDITGEKHEYDARLVKLEGPSNLVMGRDNNYYVTVDNNGKHDLENVEVTLSLGDEVIGSETLYLSEGEDKTVAFNYNPALYGEARNGQIVAKVVADKDDNPYNNETYQYVNIDYPNLPYVNDLSALATDDGKIHLFWSDASTYPYETAVKDDFESYPDFTISDFGEWTVYDVDGRQTIPGIGSSYGMFVWANAGAPQAWINFVPERAYIQGSESISGGVTALVNAHSGKKCLASFVAEGGANNDWLVTPALSGNEQVFSFYVKSIMGYDYPESFSIMISTSGNQMDDFTPLRENVKVSTIDWSKYAVTLPAGTRYVAIVCNSDNGYALLLDDFEFVPELPEVELTGYNVYRDYTLLAEGLGETEHFAEVEDADKEHLYHVTATYSDGESIFSNGVCAAVSGVGQMPVDDNCFIYSAAGAIIVKSPAGSPVTVHTLDGRCIYSFASTGAETMRVAPGIYIVRAGTATAKLIVK